MNPAEPLTPAQRELRMKYRARWLGLEVTNQDGRTFLVTRHNDPDFRFPLVGYATLEEIENVIQRLEQ